jgi:flagellin FlaB
MNLRNLIRKASRGEEGITGLETAIILIAFVVVATVFAFVVLTTGIFSAERGKETVFAGLAKARGTMEVRGGIVITDDDAAIVQTGITLGTIQFSVATTAGGEAIPLDFTATTNRTVIAFRDAANVGDDVEYLATPISGDTDSLLEPGELFLITIDIADIETETGAAAGSLFAPNDRITLEIQTPVGAVLDLTRSLPAQLDAVMQLH